MEKKPQISIINEELKITNARIFQTIMSKEKQSSELFVRRMQTIVCN